jgi:hypothetical protein
MPNFGKKLDKVNDMGIKGISAMSETKESVRRNGWQPSNVNVRKSSSPSLGPNRCWASIQPHLNSKRGSRPDEHGALHCIAIVVSDALWILAVVQTIGLMLSWL